MRSGDPGPDRPRAHRESPDLTASPTRIVPAQLPSKLSPLFVAVAGGCPNSPCVARGPGAKSASPPLSQSLRLDLPRCAVPMFLVPSVRLPLRLPKRIGALLD